MKRKKHSNIYDRKLVVGLLEIVVVKKESQVSNLIFYSSSVNQSRHSQSHTEASVAQ